MSELCSGDKGNSISNDNEKALTKTTGYCDDYYNDYYY